MAKSADTLGYGVGDTGLVAKEIDESQWEALRGHAALTGGWVGSRPREDVDDDGVGDLTGGAFVFALDLILFSIATILLYYRPF